MHIIIDLHDQTPIHEQLTGAIKGLLNRRQLNPDDRLPTVRQLAQDLGINLNTVARAYRELAKQGVLNVRQGRGASVVNTQGRCDAQAHEALRRMVARLVNEAMFLGIGPQKLHDMVDAGMRDLMKEVEP